MDVTQCPAPHIQMTGYRLDNKVSHPPPQCHEYYPTTNICKLHQKPKLSLKYSELVRGLLLLSPNHHLNVKSNFQPEANPPPGYH